jgi:hypothetical protein
MIDALGSTGVVKPVPSGRFAFAGSAEAVGKFFAVVAQEGADAKRSLGAEPLKELGGRGGGFVGLDLEVNPTARPVNRREEVLMFGFVRHPRQVLDIDMDEPRRVRLEGLGERRGIRRFGPQIAQPGHPMATQAAIQGRARRQVWTQKFADHHTTHRSSSGSKRSLRSSTTTDSCRAFSGVASRWGMRGRFCTSSRARQRRIVVSLTPSCSTLSATDSVEVWINARCFGGVVALA